MRGPAYIERGEGEGKTPLDAMRDGELDGMQHFDGAIERLVREGTISVSTALAYATNPDNMRLALVDSLEDVPQIASRPLPERLRKSDR